MFTDTDITRLITTMRANAVTLLEVDGEGGKLRIKLPPVASGTAPSSAAPTAAPARKPVKSPTMGRFVPCGTDDGLSAAQDGAPVQAGAVLGYVAYGAARVPVSAPCSGQLRAGPPVPDALVGYGDTLFEVEPA